MHSNSNATQNKHKSRSNRTGTKRNYLSKWYGYFYSTESDVPQYQGQAYDVIFMEEATQFTEFQFTTLTESNRSSGLCKDKFTPRMYFTCNPGGIGHNWVKRLFIDRQYTNKERPEDYTFIKSLV